MPTLNQKSVIHEKEIQMSSKDDENDDELDAEG